MSFTLPTAIVSLALLLAVPMQGTAAQAPAEDAAQRELPVSLSRIRDALKKPDPRLSKPRAKPDFSVDINEEQRFQDLVDLLDFSAIPSLPAVRFGGSPTQPLFNVSLSNIGVSVAKGVSKARRERAERLAREEVQRALIQFCSSHECAAR
ncbi:MAG: hypothetical protein ABJA98_23240 [Acidobacteriota bacterium]